MTQGGFGGKNLNLMKKEIFDDYAKAIAKQFNLTLEELFTKKRSSHLVDARQMLYWLCMERPMRVSYITKFLKENGYDVGHSTIISGYESAKKTIDADPDWAKMIKNIQDND